MFAICLMSPPWFFDKFKFKFKLLQIEGLSDEEFKHNYEQLYNPDGITQLDIDENSDVYIPIIDDPVQPDEVMYVVNHQLNPNKSCGPDGISAGIFKLLPIDVIMFITLLIKTRAYTHVTVWIRLV